MRIFLCYTPLHVLIASRIIEKEGTFLDKAVYICFNDNSKNQYYFQKLKKLVETEYLPLAHRHISDFRDLVRLAKRIKSNWGQVKTIITGNLKHSHTRALALLLNINRFMSFDDGSGNISGAGYLYEESESSIAGRVIGTLSSRLKYSQVIRSIEHHYTIYPYENLVDKYAIPKTLISLIEQTSELYNSKQYINLYLSNAFSVDGLMTKERELLLDKAIVEKFRIDKVVPHPRRPDVQLSRLLDESCQIAEELVMELLLSGYSVNVYGVYSTSLINLSNLPRVMCTNIKVPLKKPVSLLDDLFKRIGIASETLSLG